MMVLIVTAKRIAFGWRGGLRLLPRAHRGEITRENSNVDLLNASWDREIHI